MKRARGILIASVMLATLSLGCSTIERKELKEDLKAELQPAFSEIVKALADVGDAYLEIEKKKLIKRIKELGPDEVEALALAVRSAEKEVNKE